MTTSRRDFIKRAAALGAGSFIMPTIIPASVLGKDAPSNKINVGAIGVGRISRGHDLPGIWKYDFTKIMAACDVDSVRLEQGKELINNYYAKKTGKAYNGVATYENYLDMLNNKDIDAVVISTPDHWHAKQAIDAVYAGKDVYLQKPASLTIEEGRLMSDAVNRTGRIFQIGSQQRSWKQFREAVEFVRNGRIGDLISCEVRLPGDPAGGKTNEMPVPKQLNYDLWIGPTPYVYYTEDRVHPPTGYGRPGWLRCEQFGAGMITGWGTHHFDIVHWAMNLEHSGPVEISGKATFPTSGLWDVHGNFETELLYPNGVKVYGLTENNTDKPNGILFKGTKGWIFVSRGDQQITTSDPTSPTKKSKAIDASDPKILAPLGDGAWRVPESKDHHGNWLEAVKNRTQPIAPAEVAHRSCTACLLQHIAMKLQRKLYWDPIRERFKNDDEANSMISRPQRAGFEIR
ncbi:Gfo/Idh/MocA family protein [Prevotella sp. 10(H)]|uniref:Gfo/Idh/MocA family protein n=1 Tax=Prevotella sp. 10(H) TaxID=1158294 RepID=UPI0004A774C9|nr:Gfo/Idh/MocA family oxidoreductase [Prevotella sp. 10(H)]